MNYGNLDLPEKEYHLEPEKEINLSRGDLNFNTPNYVIDAAIEAMKTGYTHYIYRYGKSSYTAPQLGLPDLRNAIRQYYRKYGVTYEENEILVTSGSASALYLIFNYCLNQGDEVLVTEPTYPGYFKILERIGVKITQIPLNREDNWDLDTDYLNEKLSSETKMVVLCNPLNPTGKVFSKRELDAVAEIVQDKKIKILSDEIYNEYIWNGLQHNALTEIPEMKDNTFVVQSFSKTFSMTGWRLGYILGSKKEIMELSKLPIGYTPATFIQKAGSVALRGLISCDQWGPPTFIELWRREITRRLRFFHQELHKIDGVICRFPDSTFYLWPDFKELNMTTNQVVELIANKNVIVDPGTKYGDNCDGHVRIGMVQPYYYLEEAANRIHSLFENLQ
jgi:aspartate/methionine/tyrosine aminotransferase